MKKYFIAVAALALLAACSGKKTNEPAIIEEETVAVAESVPDVQAVPLPIVSDAKARAGKANKPVNMRDSLKIDSKKGAVMQKKYKGKFPTAAGSDIDYDLTLYYQQDSDDGVYEMDATYVETDNGQNQTYTSTGKRKVKHGTSSNSDAVVYELIPSDGTMSYYFLAVGDSLLLLDEDMQQPNSNVNYALILVP